MNVFTRVRQISFLLVLFIVTSCTIIEPVPDPTRTAEIVYLSTTTEIELSKPQPTAVLASPCQFTPFADDDTTSTHPRYHLNVSLNYADHKLKVAQTIAYTNTTGAALSNLPLLVPPAYHQDTFLLTFLQIDPVYSKTTVRMEGAQIRFLLNPVLDPGETINLTLNFVLQIPQGKGTLGYTRRQMLLADWYPIIPHYLEGRGWLINPPSTVGEYLVYPLINISVNLQIAPPDPNLVVAASAPLHAQEENCYQYSSENVRNFSLAVSPFYQRRTRNNQVVTVEVYTFPEHSELGDRTADLALQAWGTFTEIYGDNQRQFLSVVEADIEDGLECDGLFYLSDWYFETADETPKNYFELLVVHETSHQWFYGLVHNDQANEPWLDESLATYSELLFFETNHPELVEWWWDFRVWSFERSGAVNGSIYDFNEYRPYINAVYLHGAAYLQTVRDHMGDTAFFDFLLTYTQTGQEDFLRDADFFFSLLAQATDIDLTQITSEYFR